MKQLIYQILDILVPMQLSKEDKKLTTLVLLETSIDSHSLVPEHLGFWFDFKTTIRSRQRWLGVNSQ